jgi:hypothetical protein
MLYVGLSNIHGRGVFTKCNIPPYTKLNLMADLNKYSAGENCMTEFGSLVNHKRLSNCGILEKDGLVYLITLKRIKTGEELTINYTTLPFPFKSDVTGYKQ